jgi:hypothetical protein
LDKGKKRYNWSRPIAVLFGALVFGIGLFGMWCWINGSLDVVFNSQDGFGGFFPKFMAVAFAVLGPIASSTAFFSSVTHRRIDKWKPTELECADYSNGTLVTKDNVAQFYSSLGFKTIQSRGFVKTRTEFYRNSAETWSFLVP